MDMVIVLPVAVQDRVYGPDSAARGVPQLPFLDKVVTCPLFRRQARGGAAGAVPVVVDVPVIMQRHVVSPTVEMPQIQFIDRVDGVRDGVLLVLPSVVQRDRYPQCFSWCRCLRYGTRLLYGGL